MPKERSAARTHLVYHNDGSLWARGTKRGNVFTGDWEWFRKDGTRLRSGTFEHGRQVGTWTTYDRQGKVYKVTHMKPARQRAAVKAPRKTARKKRAG